MALVMYYPNSSIGYQWLRRAVEGAGLTVEDA
jgi:hypothetical protein